MDWVPVGLVIFKAIVLGTGMFFAIKWHYDQGKKNPDKKKERQAVLKTSIKVFIGFVILTAILGIVTFKVGTMVGLDLSFS